MPPLHPSFRLWPAVLSMTVVVVASNILVQYPINDWFTYGAFTYPISFLVTDLTNRRYGPQQARRIAMIGFCLAVVLSLWLATPRIALASGCAFLSAQFLDVSLFDRLRHGQWWRAPLISSAAASVLDTALFFSLAFAATGLPWLTWALGDLACKLLMALLLLGPFRLLLPLLRQQPNSA